MEDAENLYEHVKVLATTDGRAIGTPGHDRARKYLCANLKHLGLSAYGDSFEIEDQTNDLKLFNIIATVPGIDTHAPPILLGAHYDTFESYPGADDNAAGVAILLEIAKELVQSPAACDVIFAFFDGEELGGINKDMMGSTKFFQKQSNRSIRCGFILDLVGHDVSITNLENIMFVTGMESSPSWFKQLGAHYHSPSDTYEKLNYTKMAHFKKALTRLVYQSANDAPASSCYDSTNYEMEFLKNNLLPGLGMLDMKLESRADIDKLAKYLLGNFEV